MAGNEQLTRSPDALKTVYVAPADCVFSRGANGFLAAEIGGKAYPRVLLLRSLPLTAPEEYICITDIERKELGIIERIDAFAQISRRSSARSSRSGISAPRSRRSSTSRKKWATSISTS